VCPGPFESDRFREFMLYWKRDIKRVSRITTDRDPRLLKE
jgi:hypothetical protein